jgi:hypothetical protein
MPIRALLVVYLSVLSSPLDPPADFSPVPDDPDVSRVSSFVLSFRNATVKPLFNVADAVSLANASVAANNVAEGNITFVVMGSSKTRDKVAALKGTWGKQVSNLFVFSDEDDDELQPIVLDECRGKSTREDAQHKTLLGSKYVFEHSETPWYFLADDDTYVNVDLLQWFLGSFDPDQPLLFSYLFHDRPIWGGLNSTMTETLAGFTWPSGGAGIVVSRAAMGLLAKHLYTDRCPFYSMNDVTIGYCAWSVGIFMAHSPLFVPFTAIGEMCKEDMAAGNQFGRRRHKLGFISHNYISPSEMYELHNAQATSGQTCSKTFAQERQEASNSAALCTADQVASCSGPNVMQQCTTQCSCLVLNAKCMQAAGCEEGMFKPQLDDCTVGSLYILGTPTPILVDIFQDDELNDHVSIICEKLVCNEDKQQLKAILQRFVDESPGNSHYLVQWRGSFITLGYSGSSPSFCTEEERLAQTHAVCMGFSSPCNTAEFLLLRQLLPLDVSGC